MNTRLHISPRWFLLLLLPFLNSSCKKGKSDPNDGLPPLTFTGANTIGCRINGVPWVPIGIFGGGVASYPTSGGYYQTAFFPSGIHILIKTSSDDGDIHLFCRNYGTGYLNEGSYLLNNNTTSLYNINGEVHSYGRYYLNGTEYLTSSQHTGRIEILKSDSVNKIISGRFEFECFNVSTGKIYKISDGRFDYRNH